MDEENGKKVSKPLDLREITRSLLNVLERRARRATPDIFVDMGIFNLGICTALSAMAIAHEELTDEVAGGIVKVGDALTKRAKELEVFPEAIVGLQRRMDDLLHVGERKG